MKAGIIGLSLCGKTTLFNILTGRNVETGGYSGGSGPNVGIVKVPDDRIDFLSSVFQPKKTTYAAIEYVDVAGLSQGSVRDGGSGSQLLAHVRNVDIIIHVVRAFTSEHVPVPEDGLDPLRDIETLDLELMLADLAIAEKRIEKLQADIKKKGQKDSEMELQLMTRLAACLEQEQPVRQIELTEDEERLLRGYQFLTAKPMLVVLNISEDEIQDSEAYRDIVANNGAHGVPTVLLSAEIESEIAQLEEKEDIDAFMQDMGIAELSLTRLIRSSYELLGLISFFTVGADEVRAWTITRNTKAAQAAGVIHSDLERGFIRAEILSYDDFLKYETFAKAKQHGVLRVEGKEYLVHDGDIMNVRFNV